MYELMQKMNDLIKKCPHLIDQFKEFFSLMEASCGNVNEVEESIKPLLRPELAADVAVIEPEQKDIVFTPAALSKEQIADIRLAAKNMSGPTRRKYMAEMSLKYCNGNARLTEKIFGWSREAIAKGLKEKNTGVVHVGLQSKRCGRKRWEKDHPEAAYHLKKVAESHAQQDPTFKSTIAYTRLTASAAIQDLKDAGFSDNEIPSLSVMTEVLNRTGYRLRKIVKAKPQKKIKETDAIFVNNKKKTKKVKPQLDE